MRYKCLNKKWDVLLVHYRDVGNATEDPIDPRGSSTMLERDIFLAGYYKAFALGRWAM